MSDQDASAPRKDSRLRKLLRLGAYCVAVGTLGGGLALNSAYGSVKDATLQLGAELGKLDGAGSKRPILLNGEPVYVSSAVEDVPLGELLDRVEARCRENPIGITAELPGLPDDARALLQQRLVSKAASGIVRHERPGRGMIACFMRNDNATGADGVRGRLEQLMAVAETGDLSKLGNLRYVFAEENEEGRTHVVTAWTDGPFNLHSLIPAGGDTPGSDLEGVPRPAGSVRLLTATIDQVPYSVRVYDAPSSPARILAQYDHDLARRGWRKVLASKSPGAVYERPGVQLYVIPAADKGRTMVTLIQLPGR